ncbi:MAG: carbohydrate ABC transporter permease [Dehalococcoidia bacterium]|nr:carbohydrate ABC transporter permease [Dehalococcoidia bacterium]
MRKPRIILYAVAWLIGLLWVLPFLGVFVSSLRPFREVVDGWWRLEEFTLTLDAFIRAWNHPSAPVGPALLNSVYIAVPATLLTIMFASLAAYAFARFKFRLKSPLFFLLILIMAMPGQSIIIPLFAYMVDLGLLDTRLGLILVHTAWGIPWAVLFLRNFFLSVPIDLEESARVDGASDLTVFRRIVLPIALPAIVSIAVLQFVWVWNDFLFALILIQSPGKKVITQTIPMIQGRFDIPWSVLSAASVLSMIVPLLIFVFLQRYYIKGVMAGAIKG